MFIYLKPVFIFFLHFINVPDIYIIKSNVYIFEVSVYFFFLFILQQNNVFGVYIIESDIYIFEASIYTKEFIPI